MQHDPLRASAKASRATSTLPLAPVDSFVSALRRLFPLGIAIALLVLTTVKAYVDFDISWDSIAYHLPFAALRVGLALPSQFQLTGVIQHYYQGFPALSSYIKGGLWLLFGRPEAANLLSLASFVCLLAYVCRVYKLPFAWVVIALASIPVVLVSLARSQIDLPANAFMAILALSVCDWYLRPSEFGRAKLAAALAQLASPPTSSRRWSSTLP